MAPIRAHTKSRNGCRTCKKRKVKCDETGFPRCGNCARREIDCDWPASAKPLESLDDSYPDSPSSSQEEAVARLDASSITPHSARESSSQLQSPTSPTLPSPQSPLLDMASMELLHHYTTETCLSVIENSHWSSLPLIRAYQVMAPKLGLTHPSLMHSILALSALHLHRTSSPMTTTDYYSLSCYHRRHARLCRRPTICPDGACPGNHSCTQVASAQFMSEVFLSLHAFCEAITSHGKTSSLRLSQMIEWIEQQKSTTTNFFTTHHSKLYNGPFAAVLTTAITEVRPFWDEGEWKDNPGSTSSIRHLHKSSSGAPDDTELYDPDVPEIYRKTVFFLDVCSRMFNSGGRMRGLFTWASIVTFEYIDLLKKRRPRALLILAHFCALFQELVRQQGLPHDAGVQIPDEEKALWWMAGADDCVDLIRGELPDERWRTYLDHTLSEAGYHFMVKAVGHQGVQHPQSPPIETGWELSTLFTVDSLHEVTHSPSFT